MKFPSWKVVPPRPWLQETICNGDLQVGDISNILNISWLVPREMYEMTISQPLSTNCHVNALSRQHIIPFLTASSALPRSSRKLSCAHAYLCIRRGRKRERKKVKSPSELQVRDVNWRWRRTTWFQRKTALAVSSGSGSGFARKTLNKIWLSAKYTAKLLPPKVAVPRICFTTWNAIHYKTKNASNAACPHLHLHYMKSQRNQHWSKWLWLLGLPIQSHMTKKVQNGKRSRPQWQNTSPKTWSRLVLWKSQDSLRHSKYDLPGCNFFSEKALTELYMLVREKVAHQLTNMTHFSTTTHLWSSTTCEPYLSLTVHYIDNWELKSLCLQTSFFPDDHTGELIAQGLQDALMSWNLSETRQVCITTDNGNNIIKTVSLNEWTRLQCFGHRLHLAIGEYLCRFASL